MRYRVFLVIYPAGWKQIGGRRSWRKAKRTAKDLAAVINAAKWRAHVSILADNGEEHAFWESPCGSI